MGEIKNQREDFQSPHRQNGGVLFCFKPGLEIKRLLFPFIQAEDQVFEKFSRYFELLHFEHIMSHHLNKSIFQEWGNFRENEFKDEKKYANKTFTQWWDIWSNGMPCEGFIKEMKDLKNGNG